MSDSNNDYAEFLKICRNIDFPALKNLLFTLDAPQKGASHAMPRLNILLSGSCTFQCCSKGEFKREILNAPGIYYCSQNGYQILVADNERKCLNFCYNASHIRVIIFQDGFRKVTNTSLPLPESGKKLIAAAEQLWREGEQAMCRRVLNELFLLTVKTIQNSTLTATGGNSQLWINILGYINTHPNSHISRSSIARTFGISPGYVSKLARKYNNTDFVTLVNEFKLGQAAMLLSSSALSIPEIAECTGFKYTSYFFRSFRKYYQMTPKEYREKNHSC